MHVVGIDSHKATLAACAVDETGVVLAERTFSNEPAGFEALVGWLTDLEVGRTDLVVLIPGYGATAANLVAARHRAAIARLLRKLTGVHAELARDRLARLNRITGEVHDLERRIERVVVDHPLRTLPGAGPLVAAKLIGEVGDISRFRSADAFAMLAGVAPIPASSGQVSRMRLNRGGNRQLNRALWCIAFSQAKTHEPARQFIARKRAEGKSWREAMRALKRHLARVVFRLLSQPITQVPSVSSLGA